MPKEMDVSKAMLLDSDDKTYRVYHPQRGEMRIARASVDDNTRKFIDGLPKFADGGLVDEEDKTQPIEEILNEPQVGMYSEATPQDIKTIRAYEEKPTPKPWGQRAEQIQKLLGNEEYYPAGSTQRQTLEKELSGYSKDAYEPGVANFISGNTPGRQQYLDKVLSNPKGYGLTPEKEKTLREERYGKFEQPKQEAPQPAVIEPPKQEFGPSVPSKETQIADRDIIAADNRERFYDSVDKQIQNNIRMSQQALADERKSRIDREERQKQIYDDFMSQKINPDRYWGSKASFGSWMARMGAAISVGISGFGSALLKQPGNTALDMIMKQIDQDIEAQKAEMDKKKNLLSMHMQMTNNAQEAERAARSDMLTLASAQIQLMGARANNAETQMRSQLLQQQIQEKKLQNDALMEQQRVEKAMQYGGAADKGFASLPPSVAGRYAMIPVTTTVDGKPVTTTRPIKMASEEEARKVNSDIADINTAMTAVKKLNEFIPQNAEYSPANPLRRAFSTEMADRAAPLRVAAAQAVAQALDAGNKKDAVERYMKLIGDPLDIKVGNARTANNAILSILQDRLNSIVSARVPGYSLQGNPTKGLK